MTTHLIVNADDYGRSAGVSRGIREAHRRGIVTSTTCMMNFPTTANDIALALQEAPRLGLGVHLVLTAGRPLLPAAQVPTLTTVSGEFYKLAKFTPHRHNINPAEAKAEWRTQIEAFIQAAGRKPTHLDSHHHSSYYTGPLFQAMLELAQEFECAIRPVFAQEDNRLAGLPRETYEEVSQFAPPLLASFSPPTANGFYPTFYDEMATKAELLRIIGSLPTGGHFEVMCHPGYADHELVTTSIYARQRERELGVLTDDEIKQAIAERDIQMATFAHL